MSMVIRVKGGEASKRVRRMAADEGVSPAKIIDRALRMYERSVVHAAILSKAKHISKTDVGTAAGALFHPSLDRQDLLLRQIERDSGIVRNW